MGTPLRLGIVGCGHLTQKGLLRHLLQEDVRVLATVTALADAVPERARGVAEAHDVPHHFGSLEAMLAETDVDAVLVITPIQKHHEHTMACLTSGRHVYVQKTMAATGASAREMVATAIDRGLTLAAAPGQMLSPAYQQMKRTLAEGGIGALMWCYAGTTDGNEREMMSRDGRDQTWRFLKGGGPLWNTTVYSLHALTGIVGPAREVRAMTSVVFPERTREGVPFAVTEVDNATLLLRFDGGALGFSWGCRSATGRVLDWGAIGFYGTDGSLEATRIHMESGWPDEVRWRGRGEARTLPYPAGGFAAGEGWQTPIAPPPHAEIPEQHVYLDVRDFLHAVHEGRPPAASAAHAAHVVEIIEKAYAAADTGAPQAITSAF
jgi:predicted dehydrogenase